MPRFLPLLIAFLFVSTISLQAQIRISEYSASNLNEFPDNFGKYEDWIELHNTSNESIDISGWHLSDKEDKPEKWVIPQGFNLPANGYRTFWCSSRDTFVQFQLAYHTNFKLTQTKNNEVLMLSSPDLTLVDQVPVTLTLLGHSYFRAEGSDEWVISKTPSPGNTNQFMTPYAGYTAAPEMDLTAGFYNGEQTISISPAAPNTVIRYTLDGSLPTTNSPEYTTPITISTTTVVKAGAFSSDPSILPGKIIFNTYFIDETFTLPVYSVAADNIQDLANGQGALRPIGSIEYFDVNQERISSSYGELNRHGQDSWVNPHRSLDWISRDEMGYSKAVFGELFSYSDRDEHQRLMFRASGDDNYPATDANVHNGSAHVRDEYVHTLAQEGGMQLDIRAVERVILFLDGEYWGVYGLRERPVDHDYTKEYYDQGKFDLHYLLTWGQTWAEYGGDKAFQDWSVVREFILNNDMGDSTNYQFADDNLNMLSLIDYMIANLNSVASDWLNYNTGWWRGTNPDGDHKKWGYILWDNDATFDYYINYSGVPNTEPDAEPCDIDEISEFMDDFFNNPDPGKHEKIFLKLQEESDVFRQLYYSRQADLMNTVYTCDNMLSTLNRMIEKIEPEMPRQIERWGGSMTEWLQNVAKLRNFIQQRCNLLDDGMINCFELDGPYPLTLMVEPAGIGVGEIDLNTLDIEEFPWSGQYFGGMENKIKAKSFLSDYEFLYWESKSGNVIFPDETARKATITLTQSDTLVAVFGIPTSNEDLNNHFALKAFPNPASEQLTLGYELENSANVDIRLYSVIGQEVAHFSTAGGQRNSGRHVEQLDLQSKGISSGLYFIRFKADDRETSIKVTIL